MQSSNWSHPVSIEQAKIQTLSSLQTLILLKNIDHAKDRTILKLSDPWEIKLTYHPSTMMKLKILLGLVRESLILRSSRFMKIKNKQTKPSLLPLRLRLPCRFQLSTSEPRSVKQSLLEYRLMRMFIQISMKSSKWMTWTKNCSDKQQKLAELLYKQEIMLSKLIVLQTISNKRESTWATARYKQVEGQVWGLQEVQTLFLSFILSASKHSQTWEVYRQESLIATSNQLCHVLASRIRCR